MYPFLPGHVTRPKECKKLYFIQLPKKSQSNAIMPLLNGGFTNIFIVPMNRGPFRPQEHEAPGSPVV